MSLFSDRVTPAEQTVECIIILLYEHGVIVALGESPSVTGDDLFDRKQKNNLMES